MHTVPDGRGGTIEVRDVHACGSCGQPWERGSFVMSWRNCDCTTTEGHVIYSCLRSGCGAKTPDPPCTSPVRHRPLEGHDAQGQWSPALDVGEG